MPRAIPIPNGILHVSAGKQTHHTPTVDKDGTGNWMHVEDGDLFTDDLDRVTCAHCRYLATPKESHR